MHCFGLPSGLPELSHTDIVLIALERVRTGAVNAVLLLDTRILEGCRRVLVSNMPE